MATLQGTTIKNSGYLDKVYFNTSLSTEEVIAILETLDLSKDYFVCTRLAAPQISIWIRKRESYYSIICQRTPYMDMPFNTDPQYVNEASGIVKTGWRTSFDNEGFGNPFEIQDEIDSADYQGNTIGLQNELLKNLISSTPFEAITLDEFLTGIGNALREVKGTTDKINALTFEDEIRKFKGGSGSSTTVDNGPIYEGKYRVRYFDTDGTILKIEYVESGGKLTPPDNPSYDPEYLIFAEWNYDTDNYIVEQPTDIGAIYDTVDDATYIFCRVVQGVLNITLGVSNAININWGDGIIDTNTSHTYANEGEYIIKILGNITIQDSGNMYSDRDGIYKVYIHKNLNSLSPSMFNDYNSLEIISLPKSITSIGAYAFTSCTALKAVVIPKNVTELKVGTFSTCYNIKVIIIPLSITAIPNVFCENCFTLTEILIPKSIKSIGSSAFFSNLNGKDVFVLRNSVPTLTSNGFSDGNNRRFIWVKDIIYEQIKVATNWSNYANSIRPLSSYEIITNPNA